MTRHPRFDRWDESDSTAFAQEQLFDELAALELEETGGDYAQGQRPPPSSNETAAEIRAALQALDPSNAHLTRGFVAHGIGRDGVQAEVTVQSLPDVSFLARNQQRVNVEVDRRPRGSEEHRQKHLRAMQEAQTAGMNPTATTRSVFTVTNNQGLIRDIRHVHYETQGGVVREREDARVRLPFPLTAAQAVQLGVLDSPEAARRLVQEQRRQAAQQRQQARQQRRPTTSRAPRRQPASRRPRGSSFDAFLEFGEADGMELGLF